jgi:serine/threonine protein kinase/Tol biopolymer transport system component
MPPQPSNMSLSPGSRLGSYEIVAPLGQGGMGVVYRARDLTLGREVAIKVLPDAFDTKAQPSIGSGSSRERTKDDRMARFVREAQTLAALNHPNIAHIHGFEQHAEMRALVMELVEGQDLAAYIARGPVPIPDAIAIARQLAEGLEAAHELGIVHRDLKPANIMVRSDGTVKILDFGLAKAINPDAQIASHDAMQSPTLTARATAMGIIVGTAAYMAPEQAKGRPVDRRADIWAFGVILHEMLTGHRLFHAETLPETLAHVIARDVDLTSLPPQTPPHLRTLIARCLVKDPKLRLRDIGDARLALTGDPSPASAAISIAPPATTDDQPPRRSWRETAAWSLAGLLAIVAGFFAWSASRPAPRAAPLLRLSFSLDAPVSLVGLSIALAPDGHAMVIEAPWRSGDRRLHLRRLDGTVLTPLPGTDGGQRPFWSPDSRSIGFFADSRLKRLDLNDGSVRDICAVPLFYSGTWGPGGTILFATPEGPLWRVQATGGSPTALPSDKAAGEVRQVSAVFLPGERRFVYTSVRGDGSSHLLLASLDDARRVEIPSPGLRLVWTGADRVIFTQDSVLYGQRIDYDTPALLGEPEPIATDIDVAWLGSRETVADTGLAAFIETGDRTRQFSWYARAGGVGRPIGPPGEYVTFDLSRDDRRIAATLRKGSRSNLWIIDAERGGASPLTAGELEDVDPQWSPDGRSILFGSTRDPSRSPFRANLSGDPPSRLFQFSGRIMALDDWSADGRWVFYHEALEAVLFARLIDPAVRAGETPGQQVMVMRPLKGTADQTEMSPDGRWVAFNSNESGRSEVLVVPFPPTGEKFQVSRNGGAQPLWRGDSRELFFLALDGTLMSTTVSAEPGFNTSEPVALFRPRVQPVTENIEQYAVTHDGARFLVLEPPPTAKGPVVQVISNWQQLIARAERQ